MVGSKILYGVLGGLLASQFAGVSARQTKLPGKPSKCAPKGLKTLTLGVVGDFGWTGWSPAPEHFCTEVLPVLKAANLTIPNEITNDCDPGDRLYIYNATAEQTKTAAYIDTICTMKDCSAFISVGDNFYDSGVDFTTGGILRFEESWVQMYSNGTFTDKPWYQTLGNHDIVKGQSGVDFQTKIAPVYDDRWYFGTEQLPYYTYDLAGEDWTATVVVLDTDCFIEGYQKSTSVYYNDYIESCYKTTQNQVDFLSTSFAKSNADWKFLQLHHGYMSAAQNFTELQPVIDIAKAHNGIVMNGHDHCLAHFEFEGTNFILTGGAGYAQAGDCNNGVALGPYAKYLAANSQAAANGFVTMDISKDSVDVEYYARDMTFENGDLYPVKNSLKPSYSFSVTQKANKGGKYN